MIKKLILLSAMLLAISSCSKAQMAYEKFVEGQDVYLECRQEGDKGRKYPYWYSFDTSSEGESTGYYWKYDNPMTRLELKDVFIGPTKIKFVRGLDSEFVRSINRETLISVNASPLQCYPISFQQSKFQREEHFGNLTKNNKI